MAEAICETDLEISSACLDCCMAPAAACWATEVFFWASDEICLVDARSKEEADIICSMLWRKTLAVLAEIPNTIAKSKIPDTATIKKELIQGKAKAVVFLCPARRRCSIY